MFLQLYTYVFYFRCIQWQKKHGAQLLSFRDKKGVGVHKKNCFHLPNYLYLIFFVESYAYFYLYLLNPVGINNFYFNNYKKILKYFIESLIIPSSDSISMKRYIRRNVRNIMRMIIIINFKKN